MGDKSYILMNRYIRWMDGLSEKKNAILSSMIQVFFDWDL